MSKKKLARRDCQEIWTLMQGKKQVAQVTRLDGGPLNIYLGGFDEPQRVRIVCWEDAKDYVFRWMRAGMPEPTGFR